MLRLDSNLIFTIINLLVLYFLMKKFLFGRVNDILKKREEAIRKQFEDAQAAEDEANELKTQCESSLASAQADSAQIIREARVKAGEEYDRIVKTADDEATRRIQKAEETIADEREKSMRDMQADIRELVVAAAEKVVGEQASAADSRRIYDDFIAKMGEAK